MVLQTWRVWRVTQEWGYLKSWSTFNRHMVTSGKLCNIRQPGSLTVRYTVAFWEWEKGHSTLRPYTSCWWSDCSKLTAVLRGKQQTGQGQYILSLSVWSAGFYLFRGRCIRRLTVPVLFYDDCFFNDFLSFMPLFTSKDSLWMDEPWVSLSDFILRLST